MDPLVKVLKIVDQDKKPTLSITLEALDRAKLVDKASNKNWKKYWDIIDKRWERQLHIPVSYTHLTLPTIYSV